MSILGLRAGYLAQRRPQHHDDQRGVDEHAERLARPGIEPAAVGDHVGVLAGEAGGDGGPDRRQAERLARVADPGEEPALPAVVERHQLRAQLGGDRRPDRARLERHAEQAARRRQVPGEQPGQDVAAARVALGHDHRPWPGQRQSPAPWS